MGGEPRSLAGRRAPVLTPGPMASREAPALAARGDRRRKAGPRLAGRRGPLPGPRGWILLTVPLLLLAGCTIPRWPVEGNLTSPYGIHWRGTLPGIHRGVDIAVPEGTAVRSMAPGTVRFAGWMGGYGNVVWLEHRGGLVTIYAHLSTIEVERGDRVGGREVLGRSGSTGRATGPHLHFEVWRGGRPVDPVPLLGGFPGR